MGSARTHSGSSVPSPPGTGTRRPSGDAGVGVTALPFNPLPEVASQRPHRAMALTVSELAGLSMVPAVLSRLRSWSLRHCSQPWFLRAKRKWRDRSALVTAWRTGDVVGWVRAWCRGWTRPCWLAEPSGAPSPPWCVAQTPLSASSGGGRIPTPSGPGGQSWNRCRDNDTRVGDSPQ